MSESGAAPVLSVRDLSVSYRTGRTPNPVLHHVDLDIATGEIVALVGESGSGKTTLSRSVIGLQPASARITGGSIRFDDTELVGLGHRAYARLRGRDLALVPQDPATSLDPVRTIGAQIDEVFRLHRSGPREGRAAIRSRSLELLELVGIDRPEVRHGQYPHQLSGGMRQRVLLAIAFGLRPKLLIADEPTSALDVTVQRQVLDVLDDLAHRFGTAVLLVTHDLAIATDRAHRVAVMRDGRIVETATAADVVTAPRHAYTKRLLGSATVARASRPAPPQSPADAPAIAVTGLNKTFTTPAGPLDAVRDVSFTVARGETFALVGESGSGKSTTAKLLLGLHHPSSGTITVGGRRADELDRRGRARLWRDIQLVYQNPQVSLDPRWSVERIVGEPLRSFRIAGRAERARRVAETLDHVGLPAGVLRRRPRELSGGQQQRVAIARALVVGAGILVLDEVLSALDVVTQELILELLDRLQRDLGLTYVFISHDLAVVRSVADSVAVMNAGGIVEWGSVARVFDTPAEPYTRRLLDAIPGRRLLADPAPAAPAAL